MHMNRVPDHTRMLEQAKKDGVTKVHELLEPKLRGLQSLLRQHHGEVIALRSHIGPFDAQPHVQAGIITPQTSFPVSEGLSTQLGRVLFNVEKPVEVVRSGDRMAFHNKSNNALDVGATQDLILACETLYYMKEPASAWHDTPRLSVHIGDMAATAFLSEELTGYQYYGLGKALGKQMLKRSATDAKVAGEKFALYERLIETEREFKGFDAWYNNNMHALAMNGKDVSIRPQGHEGIEDQVSFVLHYGDQRREKYEKFYEVLDIAAERDYQNDTGLTLSPDGTIAVYIGKLFTLKFQQYEYVPPALRKAPGRA